jgi:hypothetical protein
LLFARPTVLSAARVNSLTVCGFFISMEGMVERAENGKLKKGKRRSRNSEYIHDLRPGQPSSDCRCRQGRIQTVGRRRACHPANSVCPKSLGPGCRTPGS